MPTPLPYHLAIRDLLRTMEPTVWKWFGRQRLEPAALEALKFDLLKSTYRLSRESHPALYLAADIAAEKLGVRHSATLYQSQTDSAPNAGIAFAADEVHVVLQGRVESSLNEGELLALFGHEYGHHVLHQADGGEHLQAWDVLRATCLDANVHTAFQHSFRKLCLYSEVFCDRAALEVVGELDTVISMLVKVTLGATHVKAADFLAQAHEILGRANAKADNGSDGITHPEAYIRACALEFFHKKNHQLDKELTRWIEGSLDMATLDLLQQREVSIATRQLLRNILRNSSIQSDLMLSHARLYFEDFTLTECENTINKALLELIKDRPSDHSVITYFCYVLLDFATSDRELEDLPLANVLHVAETLGIKDALIPLARKELKLRKNQIDQWDQTKLEILKSGKLTKQNR